MENHKMDELFRQRLHDAEVPPPPFVWPAVEQALQERRRRKALWLLAFGLLGAATLAWFLIKNPLADGVAQWPTAGHDLQPMEEGSAGAQEVLMPKDDPTQREEASSSLAVPAVRAVPPPSNTAVAKRADSPASPSTQPSTAQSVSEFNAASIADNQDQPGILAQEYLEINFLRAKSSAIASSATSLDITAPKFLKPSAQRKKTQPKVCYDFDKQPKAWLLDVYAGPSLAQVSLTSRPDNRPYLNQRISTESRSVAMNAGVRASLMFNQNLLLRTGLHYEQVTEVFEYIDPTYVKLSINTVVVNGQVVRVDTIVEYGENYQKTYNRYSMLDVPLTLGVEMRNGRSGFSINAGASANVLFLTRGSIIDPETSEPARFGQNATLSQDVFQQRVGFSAMASIQWFWHVTPRTRLFVEPAFRQVLRPITVASHPVEQRYSMLGLRLGATTIF